MKLSILYLIILSNTLFSQNLKIDYKIGGYGFGTNGEFEKQEIIKIYPQKQNFKIDFIQLKKSWILSEKSKRNDSLKIDTLQKVSRIIKNVRIVNLIAELNKERNNFNYEVIKQNLRKSLSKKEIIDVAKKRNIFYLIGDEETNSFDEFDRKKIREIKRLQNFDKYIEYIKPKSITIETITVDSWNILLIENGNKNYKLDFDNYDLGQPINVFTKPFLNLDINIKLKKIIPKNSLLRKQIEFESLFEDYIYWYLYKFN